MIIGGFMHAAYLAGHAQTGRKNLGGDPHILRLIDLIHVNGKLKRKGHRTVLKDYRLNAGAP